MFIESCEVQMSGAIVGMLQYLIQSLQKHAQNMSIQPIHRIEKKQKKISHVFFQSWVLQLLFNQKYITVKNAFSFVVLKKEREREPGKKKVQ